MEIWIEAGMPKPQLAIIDKLSKGAELEANRSSWTRCALDTASGLRRWRKSSC